MSIIQGTNTPIRIDIDDDEIMEQLESTADFHAMLVKESEPLLHWTKDDVVFTDTGFNLPLEQDETMELPPGSCKLEMKWLDEEGYVIFSDIVRLTIKRRHDHHILGGN